MEDNTSIRFCSAADNISVLGLESEKGLFRDVSLFKPLSPFSEVRRSADKKEAPPREGDTPEAASWEASIGTACNWVKSMTDRCKNEVSG